MKSFDLIFLGGGISALMVSRYLKLQNPNLKILILEKKIITNYNPGESTVGVAGLFLIRDLQLSTYCYLNHLPKNGLRYFFHDEQQNFVVEECSEIGSNILPIFPTFQIDRKSFDADLQILNQKIGIEIELGAKVTDLNINDDKHIITYKKDNKVYKSSTKWLINSLGRANNQFKIFDEISPKSLNQSLKTASSWGRFTNVSDIDLLGDKKWQKKVGFTSRYLSTNHFMGEGYWIWVIPIGKDIVSFGIVYDYKIIKEDLQDPKLFLNFLKSHPFCKLLIQDAQQIDFQCSPHLAYKRTQFAHKSHISFLAESYAFVDPFYSPGSDIIARQAYLLEHLINSNQKDLSNTIETINKYVDLELSIIQTLYQNQYLGFASFELFNIKSLWDFHSYTNRMVFNFYQEKFKDLNWIKREIDAGQSTLKLTKAIQTGFVDLALYLKENKIEKRYNLNQYSLRQNRFKIEEEILLNYNDDQAIIEHLNLCKITVCELLQVRYQYNFDKKIIQDQLNFSLIQNFQLNNTFLEKLLKKLVKTMSRNILSKFQQKLEVELQIEDFSLKVPQYFKNQSKEMQQFIYTLWNAKTPNPLQESFPKL
ncbi:MAG: hypothetical protein COB02_05315 [Candidatus Cloacimonadota bacterium]|nr:MAG: hypothetical protein COB02_05315 [Candidatus Cloacimonadota bacterium]